jgi:plastocyanin
MPYCTSCGNEVLSDAVFCPKCGKPIQTNANSTVIRKRSKRWYLLPIFIHIIGGIICYYALKNDDKKLATICLKLGVILFLVNIAIGITVGVYEEYQHKKLFSQNENNPYLACPDCNNAVSIAVGSGSSASANCVSTENCYSPSPLTISSGTMVIWTNRDTVSHTVTSGKANDDNAGSLFDSGLIKSGDQFEFTFRHSGTYDYFCSVHPWMTGQVIAQ